MEADTPAERDVLCPHCKSDLSAVVTSQYEELKMAKDNIETLERRNERLTAKLEQNKGYTEELRVQVQNLAKEIDQLKFAKSRSTNSASQYEESDAKKAADLSRYGYAIDRGAGDSDHKVEEESKWDSRNSASIADQAREAAEEATRTQGRDYTRLLAMTSWTSIVNIGLIFLITVKSHLKINACKEINPVCPA